MFQMIELPLNGTEGCRFEFDDKHQITDNKVIDPKTNETAKDYLTVTVNLNAIIALREIYRKERGDNCNLTELHTISGEKYEIPAVKNAILQAIQEMLNQQAQQQSGLVVPAGVPVGVPVGTDRVPHRRVGW